VDVSKGSRALMDVLDVMRRCPSETPVEGELDWLVPVVFANSSVPTFPPLPEQPDPAFPCHRTQVGEWAGRWGDR
jgi:hypothetical protein